MSLHYILEANTAFFIYMGSLVTSYITDSCCSRVDVVNFKLSSFVSNWMNSDFNKWKSAEYKSFISFLIGWLRSVSLGHYLCRILWNNIGRMSGHLFCLTAVRISLRCDGDGLHVMTSSTSMLG